jgi:hypothetical protein
MATGLQQSHAKVFQEAIRNGLQSFVLPSSLVATTAAGTPATGFFYSSIDGRAPAIDVANDLRVSMGTERIPTRLAHELFSEIGPAKERVWAMPGESRIRFIGEWSFINDFNKSYRAKASSSEVSPCYIEVLFYGTGLNLLMGIDSIYRANITCSIDQGAFGSNLFALNNWSPVTNVRNYGPNQILKVASGLTMGLHTALIKLTGSPDIYGLEILNEQTSNVRINPGTAFIDGLKVVSAGGSLSYNSEATETKGGRQLIYLRSNGTIGSAFTPVDATVKYLANTDHTNEELVKTYSPREFGNGSSYDFASLTGAASNTVFTLSDGTTTLNGRSVQLAGPTGVSAEGIVLSSFNSSLSFTFVGTGIDIVSFKASTTKAGAMDPHSVMVDGVAAGVLSESEQTNTTKIASGLPYGTHVVKITRPSAGFTASVSTTSGSTTVVTASTTSVSVGASIVGSGIPAGATVTSITNSTTFVISAAATATAFVSASFSTPCYISSFKVYQPKKPALPVETIELADYNILGAFSANSTPGDATISSGIIRKMAVREASYQSPGYGTTFTQTISTVENSDVVTVTSTASLSAGLYLTSTTGIPNNAYIVSILSSTTFLINTPATATGSTTGTFAPSTWAASLTQGASVSGYTIDSSGANSLNSSCVFHFWGTGVEVRMGQSLSSSVTNFNIDGYSNFTSMPNGSGGTGITTSTYGGAVFTSSSGVLTGSSGVNGAGVQFSNLPLGLHTITVTKASTSGVLSLESFDVITPIYSPKIESNYVMGTSQMIGSNSISDNRKDSLIKKQNKDTLVGQTIDQTSQSTTSATFVPIPGAATVINTELGGWYRIHWSSSWTANTLGAFSHFRLMINGQISKPFAISTESADMVCHRLTGSTNSAIPVSIDKMVYLGPGSHFIQIHWKVGPSGATATCNSNIINVVEEN